MHPEFSTSILFLFLHRLKNFEKKYFELTWATQIFSCQIILKENFCFEIIVELYLLVLVIRNN